MSAVELREVLPAVCRRVDERQALIFQQQRDERKRFRDRNERGAGACDLRAVWEEPAPGGGETAAVSIQQPAVANDPARGAEGLPSVRGDNPDVEGQTQIPPLWRRLLVLYGHGERPELRIALFQRVDQLCATIGIPMVRLVREAVTGAKGRTNPAHYFCRAIRAKISEAGFLEELP